MSESRLEALRRFLEEDPNDSFTRYALAMEYVSMNDIASATHQLQMLLGEDPEYVPAYHQLGIIFSRSKRRAESKKLFLDGIEAATRTGDTHARQEMQEALDELEDEL